MKNNYLFTILALNILLFSSFKGEEKVKLNKVAMQEVKGNELFKTKGCALCHSPEKTIVGPSLTEIANAYKGDVNKVLDFMNGKSDPIVKKEEFKYMKPVLGQLKKMKPEERKALATYYMSFFKK